MFVKTSNIPGWQKKQQRLSISLDFHLLRFHTNELRYTTSLVAFLDGLSS